MACSGDTKTYVDQPQWLDSLGPTSINPKTGKQTFTPTGAVQQRSDIYGALDAAKPGIADASAAQTAGLKSAASDSGWGQARDLALSTLHGDYLGGSPQLDAAMTGTRRAQMASAADENARIGSQYSRAGMNFSTANQEANQSNTAAASARAGETEANTRLANYEAERTRQAAAPAALQQAHDIPLNYLGSVPGATLNPLAQEASLVSGLATGGSVATPQSTLVKQPGIADYLQGIGSNY